MYLQQPLSIEYQGIKSYNGTNNPPAWVNSAINNGEYATCLLAGDTSRPRKRYFGSQYGTNPIYFGLYEADNYLHLVIVFGAGETLTGEVAYYTGQHAVGSSGFYEFSCNVRNPQTTTPSREGYFYSDYKLFSGESYTYTTPFSVANSIEILLLEADSIFPSNTYPITYHYENSTVSGPLEAAVGDTVIVSAVPNTDYGITDATTQISVTNNDAPVNFTWDAATNRITFTMPDPS